MIFNKLQELQHDQKSKDDFDAYLRLIRLLRFYGKIIAESHILRGQAKQDLMFMHNSINAFLARLRSGINKHQIEAFDRELSKDFLAWGELIQALTYMDQNQTEVLERFAIGIVTGQIDAKLLEDGKTISINNELV